MLGYRRADVDQAIDEWGEAVSARDKAISERDATLIERQAEVAAQGALLELEKSRNDELERVAERLSERVVERERELKRMREELSSSRAAEEGTLTALAALATELEDVRGQARGQATKIRLRALRDAAEVTDRIADLAKRPAEARERLLESLQEAIGRLGEGEEVPADSNGHDPNPDQLQLFEGLIEVDFGPLSDFSQLVGFEDAVGGIGATSEISVKRFAKGRATIEMKLKEPVELLRELEERAPFEFVVRDTRADRVVLDLDGE